MKRRRGDSSWLLTPPRASKTSTRARALVARPADAAPLEARFRAAAEEPSVIVSLMVGVQHSEHVRESFLSEPRIAATRVFEHLQSSSAVYSKSEADIQLLNGSNRFTALGGCPWAVHGEWTRLNRRITADESLRSLNRAELFSRLFIHFVDAYPNVLLLAACWHAAAMDVRLADDGSSLLRSLRHESQDHQQEMLFYLVGHAWQVIGDAMDVSTLSVKPLVKAYHSHKVVVGLTT